MCVCKLQSVFLTSGFTLHKNLNCTLKYFKWLIFMKLFLSFLYIHIYTVYIAEWHKIVTMRRYFNYVYQIISSKCTFWTSIECQGKFKESQSGVIFIRNHQKGLAVQWMFSCGNGLNFRNEITLICFALQQQNMRSLCDVSDGTRRQANGKEPIDQMFCRKCQYDKNIRLRTSCFNM